MMLSWGTSAYRWPYYHQQQLNGGLFMAYLINQAMHKYPASVSASHGARRKCDALAKRIVRAWRQKLQYNLAA